MAGNKRWTTREETYLLNLYDEIKSSEITDEELFESIADKFPNRSAKGLAVRYTLLTTTDKKEKVEVKSITSYDGFLDGIQQLKDDCEAMYLENMQLKARIRVLEKQQEEFEVLAKIMNKARQMVVTEELGEVEQIRLKMDQNGNLDRVR